MGHRNYSRRPNGRFRQATLENTFGLSVLVCPACGGCNPYRVGEERPVTCHACGAKLKRQNEAEKGA